MGLSLVPTGRDVPNEINVIIEIPKDAEPVKYEVDKETGAIFVDRILSTPMRYPCNYGYVPHTLCGDGDPVDVLVILPLALVPGSVIRCRPVGMLKMTDEAGEDTKLVAVPVPKVKIAIAEIGLTPVPDPDRTTVADAGEPSVMAATAARPAANARPRRREKQVSMKHEQTSANQ